MDRLFLDANVLFSIAYDPTARISRILTLADAQVLTSPYAAAQALRNIDAKNPKQVDVLIAMLKRIKVIDESRRQRLPRGIDLPENDRPILQAALACEATHLLTGDKDFRALFGRVVEGVMILRPGDYLRSREI